MPRPEPPRIYSLDEAARVLGVSRPTIYRLIKRGQLRAVRVPNIKGMRVRAQDIDAFLRSVTPVVVEVDDGRPKRSRSRVA